MEFIDGAGRLKGGAKALVTWMTERPLFKETNHRLQPSVFQVRNCG